ncbi:hypothetical protein SCWH03_01710 [Streptomyces pacificus]|uniref:Uncharacterized protein n=1 Tax=Streptomyces pacificus TaxID=2705029 RepID=A0A6A0AM10_9ACTN|nr:hypothetical protein SCWH03_01710 [Streptomyces pacificus]
MGVPDVRNRAAGDSTRMPSRCLVGPADDAADEEAPRRGAPGCGRDRWDIAGTGAGIHTPHLPRSGGWITRPRSGPPGPCGASADAPQPCAGHCGADTTWRAAIVLAVSESGPGSGTKIASR